MATNRNQKEIESLKRYLKEGREDAKDYLVFPLFESLFGDTFKKGSDAEEADIYIEGKLVVELKSGTDKWRQGFYQALHYQKKGLTFSAICVIARNFIAIWKVNAIPKFAMKHWAEADAQAPASDVGVLNARKTTKAQFNEIIATAIFKLDAVDLEGLFTKDQDTSLNEFVFRLKNLQAERILVTQDNFIQQIEQLEKFFDDKLDAIHCFYAMVGFWDVTSTLTFNEAGGEVYLCGRKGTHSEQLTITPKFLTDFRKFVESRFIFTNEGSGLTEDYYFSRFDEVISRIKPEYAKQHGIFFTDHNLSKFALWFVREYFEKRLSDKYIVLDPAGGSGNLVTSWTGHLKRKIISELQPDLLKTIERRMKLDPEQINGGFTIIPKTSENKGLNFLDKSAEQYFNNLMIELAEQNFRFDKPIAFLLNPPYKNNDEKESVRGAVGAAYHIHPSILELTGQDAGKERYLAFLGQIINIARVQMGDRQAADLDFEHIPLPTPLNTKTVTTPLILIFTPTSWLIPRPAYVQFRKTFDKFFRYEMGFIVLGNEFFKIEGRFPIAFTIWSYRRNEKGNRNKVLVRDLTHLRHDDLAVNWNQPIGNLHSQLTSVVRGTIDINFSAKKEPIKIWCGQQMYDFKRDPTTAELQSKVIYGGLPVRDPRRKNDKTYGVRDSKFIGFMDDNTPVRIKEDNAGRLSPHCDRVWFRLDSDFKGINRSRLLAGPSDNRSYCAFDKVSAQKMFTWFAITKAIGGVYPVWANQFDLWTPNIPPKKERMFYSLCFAFGLAENRCVVTKYEKDNPVKGAPEVFVDNPMCPINEASFWATVLDGEITDESKVASQLVGLVKQLYKVWNQQHCKGQVKHGVGLQEEPYFKYFDYRDFVTPYSGLIQIRKYADIHNAEGLADILGAISAASKNAKEEIYGMLKQDCHYFD